jgi:Uma2 family endonuclease
MMMSMGTTTALMTLAEFEKLDFDGGEQLELLEGELIRMPPAGCDHTDVVHRLYHSLIGSVAKLALPSIGTVYMEMGYLLSEDPKSWLQPDVSITHSNQPRHRYYEGAPLIAIEVVSPDDRAKDLDRKVRTYLSNGSQEVWVIYPEERYAWRFGVDGTAKREEQAIRSGLLPGVEILFSDFL